MKLSLCRIKLSHYVLLLMLFLLTSTMLFASNSKSSKDLPKLQKIHGGNAFPARFLHKVKVRVAVDPGSVAINEKTLSATMKQIIVVACANGDCQFTKEEAGLGFYEATFDLPKNLPANQILPVLAIACSKLGCVKSVLQLHIDKS